MAVLPGLDRMGVHGRLLHLAAGEHIERRPSDATARTIIAIIYLT
jgi:hypothetical protein